MDVSKNIERNFSQPTNDLAPDKRELCENQQTSAKECFFFLQMEAHIGTYFGLGEDSSVCR